MESITASPAAAEAVVVRLEEHVADSIRAHARDAYPRECCGALVGVVSGRDPGQRTVLRAVRLQNAGADARTRYLIPAAAVHRVTRAAHANHLDVLGFYHSHPDGPPVPSVTDRDHAWPWYTYLIVGVTGGHPGSLRGWRLAFDRGRFHAVDLTVAGREPPAVGRRTMARGNRWRIPEEST